MKIIKKALIWLSIIIFLILVALGIFTVSVLTAKYISKFMSLDEPYAKIGIDHWIIPLFFTIIELEILLENAVQFFRAVINNNFDIKQKKNVSKIIMLKTGLFCSVLLISVMLAAYLYGDSPTDPLKYGFSYLTASWLILILLISLKLLAVLLILRSFFNTYRLNIEEKKKKLNLAPSTWMGLTLIVVLCAIGIRVLLSADAFISIFIYFDGLDFRVINLINYTILFFIAVLVAANIITSFFPSLANKIIIVFTVVFIVISAIIWLPESVKNLGKCLLEKNGTACSGVALEYVENDYVTDPANFLKWAEKGCEYKSAWACYLICYNFYNGYGLEIDKEKAYNYAVKSCDLFNVDSSGLSEKENKFNKYWALISCIHLAGGFYFPDDSIHKNKEKAIELSILACENEVWEGCYRAAFFYRNLGDEINADKWLRHGCIIGEESLSCVLLINKYNKSEDKNKVDFYFEQLEKSTPTSATTFLQMAKTTWKIRKDIKKTVHWLSWGLISKGFTIDDLEKADLLKDLRETKEYLEMIKTYKK